MESTIPADAEHEVLAAADAVLTKPVLVGAAAGALLGKSLGWAVAGGVAGWLYQSAKAPQTGVGGCAGCSLGLTPMRMTSPRELAVSPRPEIVSSAAEAAADSIEADAAAVAAPATEQKSILPLVLLAAGAWWAIG